jgi:hypothetical protein
VLLALGSLCLSGPADAQALYLQATQLDGIATAVTVDLEFRTVLGGSDEDYLPGIGETEEWTASPLILTFMLGGGVSLADQESDDDGVTGVGHLGLLYRTDWRVDRVGLVVFGSAHPLAGGPALHVEMLRAFWLDAGALWFDEDRGVRWFAALAVSTDFLGDLGR